MYCRLCLAKILKRRNVEVCTDIGEQFMYKLVQKYFQLKLSKDEAASQQICPSCWKSLNDFHKFCEFVEEKQIVWKEELSKARPARKKSAFPVQLLTVRDEDEELSKIEILPEHPIDMKYNVNEDHEYSKNESENFEESETLVLKTKRKKTKAPFWTPFVTNRPKSTLSQSIQIEHCEPSVPRNSIIMTKSDLKNIISAVTSQAKMNAQLIRTLRAGIHSANENTVENSNLINELTQEIIALKENTHQSLNNLLHDQVLPTIPFDNYEDLMNFEESLRNDEAMRKTLHIDLNKITTHDEEGTKYINHVWNQVVSIDLAPQLSWRGTMVNGEYEKHPVKDLLFTNLFQAAVCDNFPTCGFKRFKEKSVVFFNKASDRLNKRLKKENISNGYY